MSCIGLRSGLLGAMFSYVRAFGLIMSYTICTFRGIEGLYRV